VRTGAYSIPLLDKEGLGAVEQILRFSKNLKNKKYKK